MANLSPTIDDLIDPSTGLPYVDTNATEVQGEFPGQYNESIGPQMDPDQEVANTIDEANSYNGEVGTNGVPLVLTEQAKSPQQKLLELTNQSLDQQKQGLTDNEAYINSLQNGFNFQPAKKLVDVITGSHLAEGEETPEQRRDKISALKNALQSQKQGLTEKQIALLKSVLPTSQLTLAQQMRLKNQQTGIDLRTDEQAARAVDKVVNDKQLATHIQRIQGAQRITDQLAEVRSGKMIDTPQFLADLNAEYVRLLTGSNSPALGNLERTEYTTAASTMKNMIQKITANPQSINSPKILHQLEAGVVSLKRSYGKAVDERTGLLTRTYKSNPVATEAMKAKAQELSSQYGLASLPVEVTHSQKNAPPRSNSKVKVTNGKETYEILASDLAGAQKDGFKVLK